MFLFLQDFPWFLLICLNACYAVLLDSFSRFWLPAFLLLQAKRKCLVTGVVTQCQQPYCTVFISCASIQYKHKFFVICSPAFSHFFCIRHPSDSPIWRRQGARFEPGTDSSRPPRRPLHFFSETVRFHWGSDRTP